MDKPIVQTPVKKLTPKRVAAKPTPKPKFSVAAAPVRKQEGTPEEAAPPEPTPLQACITEKMGHGMSEEEARNACKAELEGEKEPPPTEEKGLARLSRDRQGLLQREEAFWKEIMDKRDVRLMKQIEQHDIKLLARIQEEREHRIRKTLGIEDPDPVLHMSDLQATLRKMQLEQTTHGKRTLTETLDKPVEGADLAKSKAIVKSADDIYKDLMKNKGSL